MLPGLINDMTQTTARPSGSNRGAVMTMKATSMLAYWHVAKDQSASISTCSTRPLLDVVVSSPLTATRRSRTWVKNLVACVLAGRIVGVA